MLPVIWSRIGKLHLKLGTKSVQNIATDLPFCLQVTDNHSLNVSMASAHRARYDSLYEFGDHDVAGGYGKQRTNDAGRQRPQTQGRCRGAERKADRDRGDGHRGDEQARSRFFEYPAVSGDDVAGVEQDDVTGNHLLEWNADHMPVATHFAMELNRRQEGFDGSKGSTLLVNPKRPLTTMIARMMVASTLSPRPREISVAAIRMRMTGFVN